MSGRTGADLDDLLELRRVLGRRADDVADGALDVGRALDRFRDSSTEYVPAVPAHRARGTELAERLDDLGRRVERTRDRFVVADRAAWHRAGDWLQDRRDLRDDVVDGWHGARGGWSLFRQWVLDLDHPEAWGYAEFERRIPDRPRWMTADHVRRMKDDLNEELAGLRGRLRGVEAGATEHFRPMGWRQMLVDSRADVQHLLGRGASSHKPLEEVSGRLSQVAERFRGSRAGSVTRLGGRALGVVGVVADSVDAYHGYKEGDTEQLVTGALSAAGGAAMMSGIPPLQMAGAVVTAGVLVYEHREQIADGARAVGRGISSMAGAAASFVGGLF